MQFTRQIPSLSFGIKRAVFHNLVICSVVFICVDEGSHCETDLRHNCSVEVCRGGSVCVPLIRGGFRCERCDSEGNGVSTDISGWRIGSTVAGLSSNDASAPYRRCVECSSLTATRNEFCELRSRSFDRGSFLMFAPLKQRHRFNIRLRSVLKIAVFELLVNRLIFVPIAYLFGLLF